MNRIANIAYVEETEKYIEDQKNVMPEKVHAFIKEICKIEREYHDLVQQWGKEKGVFKVPEVKPMKYQTGLKSL